MYVCVCACVFVCVCMRERERAHLRWAAVNPVGVRIGRVAHSGILVRGHVERMSLGNPARRKRLSSERWERRERRRSDLGGHNRYLGTISVSVVTC